MLDYDKLIKQKLEEIEILKTCKHEWYTNIYERDNYGRDIVHETKCKHCKIDKTEWDSILKRYP